MFLDLLKKRRSIRTFQDIEVEQGKIDILVEAMLRSPSSRSRNPWQFYVVTDRQVIKQLSKCKEHGAGFLAKAPLVIVVCGQPSVCDVWIEDCSIATLILHLEATDLGLGSCWVQVRLREHSTSLSSEEYIKRLLDIKDGLSVEAMVGFGYPKETKDSHELSSLAFEKVHYIK